MRLIDADAIRYDRLLKTGNKEHPLEWAVSQSAINSMPTVPFIDISALPIIDNYEIVRCKDCIHWYREDGENKCLVFADIPLEPNDFCSHGERRNDETD